MNEQAFKDIWKGGAKIHYSKDNPFATLRFRPLGKHKYLVWNSRFYSLFDMFMVKSVFEFEENGAFKESGPRFNVKGFALTIILMSLIGTIFTQFHDDFPADDLSPFIFLAIGGSIISQVASSIYDTEIVMKVVKKRINRLK